jgi:hypothetical protein
MTPDAKIAKALFDLWRRDITGDTWDQISETEREAWVRVAQVAQDAAYKASRYEPEVMTRRVDTALAVL